MAKSEEKIVLGLETSCDDTAAGIVTTSGRILANEVYNQYREHEIYGGIVPEIAARSHVDHLDQLVERALEQAKLSLDDIDAIAATAGPGLVGGLMVGMVTGKALAFAAGKPFLAINHLEGHALSPRLVENVAFPYLLLLISGGHCQLISVEGVGQYTRLGTTIDDAAGEAFDKGAKVLDLGVPGGPALEQAAKGGQAERFRFPRPMKGRTGCDFSFSGLKTALLQTIERVKTAENPIKDRTVSHLAASYQKAIADCLVDRSRHACAIFRERHRDKAENPAFVMAGGVASNTIIRTMMKELCREEEFRFLAPPPWLCTDNGVMIAWAGAERLKQGFESPLDFPARARWPLDEKVKPKVGYGKRGAKV